MTNSTKISSAVTRTEFETHASHVDKRFVEISSALHALSGKLDEKSRPRYELLIGVLTLVISAIAGAAFVVNSQIGFQEKLPEVRDHGLQQQIEFQRTGNNRFTLTDQRGYEATVDERFDEHGEEIKTLSSAAQTLHGNLNTLDARLSTWIDELQSRGEWMDKVGNDVSRLKALEEARQ